MCYNAASKQISLEVSNEKNINYPAFPAAGNLILFAMYGSSDNRHQPYYSLPYETIKVDDSITKSPTINQSSVTGLILDCRHSAPERKMAPVIYDEDGRVIYSSENITYDVLLNSGLCDYVPQSSTDLSRAGNNPLTIKSIALSDFNRDFVVSRADGVKILAANAQSGMLGKAAMIVLTN